MSDTHNFVTGAEMYQALYTRVEIAVFTKNDRDAIQTYRRKWGMRVFVHSDPDTLNNGLYILRKNNNVLGDNTNWEPFPADANILLPNAILSGGNVTWTGDGLWFHVSPTIWRIFNQVFQTLLPELIELDEADPTHNRFDTFYADNDGNIGVITGVAAEDPVIPSVDPDTQILLTSVMVAAGATTPEVTVGLIYDENAPGEWTGSTEGVTVDFDAVANPGFGVKHLRTGIIEDNDKIIFTAPASIEWINYTAVSFMIYLSAAMINQENLYCILYLSPTSQSTPVEVLIPINKSLVEEYQLITINLSDFQISGMKVNTLVFRWAKQGAKTSHPGFDMDYIRFTGGTVVPPISDDVELIGEVKGKGKTGTPINTIINADDVATALANEDEFFVRVDGVLKRVTTETLKEEFGGGGTPTPQYNPIDTVLYYEDGKVKQVKTDIGSTKFIDKRVAYHDSGDNIGKADFSEIKDESTDPALWKKIQYNYTEKVLTSTTVTDIVAWTIII